MKNVLFKQENNSREYLHKDTNKRCQTYIRFRYLITKRNL